jgi:hypothetical protein
VSASQNNNKTIEDSDIYAVILLDKLTQKAYEYAFFLTQKEAINQMVYFLKKGDFCIVRKKPLEKNKNAGLNSRQRGRIKQRKKLLT